MYTLKKKQLDIDFQSSVTKLVEMTQAIKDEGGKRITLYMTETVSLGIHLKHGHM